MESTLKEQLFHSMFRLKKLALHFPPELDVHLTEIMVMTAIEKSTSESKLCTGISHMQDRLFISKPAISQILNTLEKKKYISREFDKNDRRKFVLALTPAGSKTVQKAQRHSDGLLEYIISHMGEENTKKFIELNNRFIDITHELKQQAIKANKGDDPLD